MRKRHTLPILFALLLSLTLNSCALTRSMVFNTPTSGDRILFAQRPFWPVKNPTKLPRAPIQTQSYADSLLQAQIEDRSNLSFLVIQNDSIILEAYGNGAVPTKLQDVFSVSKSFVATLIGIAKEEGKIQSIYDLVYTYLPNLRQEYRHLRLIDLLNMRTGIDNNIQLTATMYFTRNMDKAVNKARVAGPSGQGYQYSNWATQILVEVLEAATQTSLSDYFEEKIWLPLGPENSAGWSMDSGKRKRVRGFVGLSITARDLAKFGLAYLHDGEYNGKQIIPRNWVYESIHLVNQEADSVLIPNTDAGSDRYAYNMHWRVIKEGEEFFAKGLLGQYLYVNKKEKMVIVRQGLNEQGADWIRIFQEIVEARVTNSKQHPDNAPLFTKHQSQPTTSRLQGQ